MERIADAQEVSGRKGRRRGVELFGGPDCLDGAIEHYDDAIGDLHSFGLIMGHKECGDAG